MQRNISCKERTCRASTAMENWVMGCVPGGRSVRILSTYAGMSLPLSASSADSASTCSLLGICMERNELHHDSFICRGSLSIAPSNKGSAKVYHLIRTEMLPLHKIAAGITCRTRPNTLTQQSSLLCMQA